MTTPLGMTAPMTIVPADVAFMSTQPGFEAWAQDVYFTAMEEGVDLTPEIASQANSAFGVVERDAVHLAGLINQPTIDPNGELHPERWGLTLPSQANGNGHRPHVSTARLFLKSSYIGPCIPEVTDQFSTRQERIALHPLSQTSVNGAQYLESQAEARNKLDAIWAANVYNPNFLSAVRFIERMPSALRDVGFDPDGQHNVIRIMLAAGAHFSMLNGIPETLRDVETLKNFRRVQNPQRYESMRGYAHVHQNEAFTAILERLLGGQQMSWADVAEASAFRFADLDESQQGNEAYENAFTFFWNSGFNVYRSNEPIAHIQFARYLADVLKLPIIKGRGVDRAKASPMLLEICSRLSLNGIDPKRRDALLLVQGILERLCNRAPSSITSPVTPWPVLKEDALRQTHARLSWPTSK